MTHSLPDISLDTQAYIHTPINWVGMDNIDLPLYLTEVHSRENSVLPAIACFQVDIGNATTKGIHMSRLYQLLGELVAEQPVTADTLLVILDKAINQQHEAQTTQARLILRFNLLLQRPALLSSNLGGWKNYPIQLHAQLSPSGFKLCAEVKVGYSSTCPCSAALARQLLAEHFTKSFASSTSCKTQQVAHWLQQHGSFATPHSQRSQAIVSVSVSPERTDFGLVQLINCIEAALATPLQTAVKRIDEQEFARLNGHNLMFVEDAVRRIQQALAGRYSEFTATTRHLESLHAHDAIASIEQAAANNPVL